MISDALFHDHRMDLLSDRKKLNVKLLVREIDKVLMGDSDYPSHWDRIIEIAQQERAGVDYREKYHCWLGGERE